MKSIAFRNNHAAIWRGDIPDKYARLLPFITGDRITEIGCAEGVLSLLMAEPKNRTVIGCDRHRERYETALALKEQWRSLGRDVVRCSFTNADIRDRYDLIEECDMLVAVRCIYYLKDEVDAVFLEIAKRVPRVLLCGNKGRAHRYKAHKGNPPDKLGRYNFLASAEGMVQTLERAGYTVVTTVTQGDPIVVGTR